MTKVLRDPDGGFERLLESYQRRLESLERNATGTWHEVGGSGEPAFQNSWVNYGGTYETAGFSKVGGRVFLKGLVKNGTVGYPNAVFTLPVGFRPSTNGDAIFAIASNGLFGHVYVVASSGVVTVAGGSNAWASLEGISFTTR